MMVKGQKKFYYRRPDGNGGWINNLNDVRRVLYRLPELVGAKRPQVYIVEGEKDVETLREHGLIATTSGGAKTWRSEFNQYFKGLNVIILPDNDKSGRTHVQQVASSLHGIADEVKIVELPGLPEKGDVTEWLDAGHQTTELMELIDKAKPFEPDSTNVDEPDQEWELPAPLGQFDLPVFPLEAFPQRLSVCRVFCEEVAESFQVPVDLPAMLVLSIGSASLAKRIVVHVRGDHWEPVNLFSVVALPPGNRKSQVFRAVAEPLVYFERQEAERLAPLIEENRNQRIILEESLKHAQKQAAKAMKAEDQTAHKERAALVKARWDHVCLSRVNGTTVTSHLTL